MTRDAGTYLDVRTIDAHGEKQMHQASVVRALGAAVTLTFGVLAAFTGPAAAVSDGAPVVEHRFNAGFACADGKPFPRLGGFAGTLEAVASEDDDADQLSGEFAIWPKGAPEERQVFSDLSAGPHGLLSVTLPDGLLTDGQTYKWKVRAREGRERSAWSEACGFTYDRTPPATTPAISVAEYVPGQPLRITLDSFGDPEVGGFQFSFSDLGVPGCSIGGEFGQLVCPAPFTEPDQVRLDTPGGAVTFDAALPPGAILSVRIQARALDAAGNVGQPVETSVFIGFPGMG
ncbi:hypothetical protein O7635_11645 [Asanoa sp. WMMD1127]|uniref:hypothetical protein n=1 Tax=Asanoa sp. WMMD1127 TaxID=3016107 RepID=UPI002417A255|nr:hypothetical protein [Asanoa sp. WMMD1127]MDG4822503.1 hypothetical protein [Asanoa sp. WMMD1127]